MRKCFKALCHFREGTGRLLVLLVSKSLFNQAGIVISFETGTKIKQQVIQLKVKKETKAG